MENQAPDPRYSIDDLCSLANTPRRTVRFYIQQGLLDRPEGQRRGAYYTQRHLEQLLFIARWREAGLSLERIGTLLRDQSEPADLVPRRQPGSVDVWTHLAVAPGVELQLEPERANLSPEQVRAFFKAVMAAYQQVAERPESTSSHPEDSTT